MSLLPVVFGLLGMTMVLALTPCLLRFPLGQKLFCRAPEAHHTHQRPIPRVGGLALACTFVGLELCLGLFCPERRTALPSRNAIIFGSLAMFGLGFWDDLRPLGAKRKLAGQLLISLGVWSQGIGIQVFKIPFTENLIPLQAWGLLATLFWLVGMTNLINLIDGVDGVAAGICLMLMGMMVIIGYQSGSLELLACGMTGALLGFLRFNFPPARIFLGDGGAYFLGFQIGLFALVNSQKGTIVAALAAPLFVLALPIVDTALTVCRRGLHGLPIFRPDRQHIHHRLLTMGFSRRQVVLSIYSMTLVFMGFGLIAYGTRGELIPVLAGAAALIFVLCAGQLSFSREWFAVGRVVSHSIEMRQEIRYARCLTRWLALEGARSQSVETLWEDLVFTARKLGFTSVKLTLADEERLWEWPKSCPSLRVARHELLGGRAGLLELKAPACAAPKEACTRTSDQPCATLNSPGIPDSSLFEILGELVAEAWVKASSQLSLGAEAPLRFDAKVSPPKPRLNRLRQFFLSRAQP